MPIKLPPLNETEGLFLFREVYQTEICLPPDFTLASCFPYSFTLKMEVKCSTEISVDLQLTTPRYIPQNIKFS
jgi:hypothetical protein